MALVGMFIFLVYMPTYIINFKKVFPITPKTVEIFTTIILIFDSIAIIFFGFYSDKINRKGILLFGAISLLLLSYPLFYVILYCQDYYVWPALFTLNILFASLAACFAAMLPELFPVAIRYTGIAICYNIGAAVFGGITPLVATALIEITGMAISPVWYLMLALLIGIIGLLSIRKKKMILLNNLL